MLVAERVIRRYFATTGADCRKSPPVNIYCYVEIWRRKDTAMIGNDSGVGGDGCYATADTGRRYIHRNKHYEKASITIEIFGSSIWGSGEGPRGWDCDGQRTRTLTCRKNAPPVA